MKAREIVKVKSISYGLMVSNLNDQLGNHKMSTTLPHNCSRMESRDNSEDWSFLAVFQTTSYAIL